MVYAVLKQLQACFMVDKWFKHLLQQQKKDTGCLKVMKLLGDAQKTLLGRRSLN